MLNSLSTGEDDEGMLRTSQATSARIGNFDLFSSQNLHLALKSPCGTLVGTSQNLNTPGNLELEPVAIAFSGNLSQLVTLKWLVVSRSLYLSHTCMLMLFFL